MIPNGDDFLNIQNKTITFFSGFNGISLITTGKKKDLTFLIK